MLARLQRMEVDTSLRPRAKLVVRYKLNARRPRRLGLRVSIAGRSSLLLARELTIPRWSAMSHCNPQRSSAALLYCNAHAPVDTNESVSPSSRAVDSENATYGIS